MTSQTDFETILDSSLAPNNHLRRSQSNDRSVTEISEFIPVKNPSVRGGQTYHGSSYTLLKPNSDTGLGSSTVSSTTQKPFFLHPSTWLWEFLSLISAVLTLVGFMIVLAVFNGKPSPVVAGIRLNTVASFAATLFSTSLMVPVHNCLSQLGWTWLGKNYKSLNDIVDIDWASRGPLGSLQLLPKFVRSPLISIAATITVIAVAIGPFFQQSVIFYNADVVDTNATSYVSAAFTYDGDVGDTGSEFTVGISVRQMQGDNIPFNLKAAIYTGIYSSAIIAPPYPPYSCPSGNCTWDPFPTLGVSVQCVDDSSRYHLNCTDESLKLWNNATHNPCFIESVDPKYRATNQSSQFRVFKVERFFDDNSPYELLEYPDLRYNTSYSFSEFPTLGNSSVASGFTEIGWQAARNLWMPPTSKLNAEIIANSTLEAHRCIFYMSMHEIAAEVRNGNYSERTLSETTEIHMETGEAAPWVDGTALFNNPNKMIFTYTPSCLATQQCKHNSTVARNLTINENTYQSILAATSGGEAFDNSGISTFGQSGFTGSESLQLLYRSPNITKTMQSVAQYINLALRSNDTILHQQESSGSGITTSSDYVAPSHRVSGLVYVQRTQLRVRWAWLAFPITLVVAVAALLIGTIVTSRPDDVGIWKNNPLAVLLNTSWRPEAGALGAATSDEMEKMAKRLEASITRNPGNDLVGTRRTIHIREKGTEKGDETGVASC